MADHIEKVREIIAGNRYMTLSTYGNGIPWAAPVAYAIDERYCFYWYSATDAIHSQHIRHIPTVADSIPPAFQRFYQFLPEKMYKVDPAMLKIDKRLEVELEQLRKKPIYTRKG